MNHPLDDELLLLAYDELPAARAEEVASHLASCAACQQRLAPLDLGRVALEAVTPVRSRTRIAGTALALATAAALAGIAIVRSAPVHDTAERWTPTTTWSATAGYVTGGKAMMDIDAQLTRLEQEPHYGVPN
jgi:hypothetical protein